VPPLLGLPKLLDAIQILFSNLLADGLLGLGMGVERGERNVMSRPPYRPEEGIFRGGFGWHVAWLGTLIGGIVIATAWVVHGHAVQTGALDELGRHILDAGEELYLGTLVFLVLAIIQMMRAFGIRSFVEPLWSYGIRGNRLLIGLVGLVFVLQMVAVYFPPTQAFFQTTSAVGLFGIGLGLALGAVVLAGMEVEKALRRAHARGQQRPGSVRATGREKERADA
jgi:Ca2+-transporting ATPase